MGKLLLVVALLSVAGCTQQVVHADTQPPTSSTSSAAPSSSSAAPSVEPSTTTPPPPPPPPPPTPCDITDGACVQLSTNQTWLLRGNKIAHGPFPITSGMPGYNTPIGKFPVLRKVKDEWSKPYNGPMPYSTYFTHSGIAFHEGSLTQPSHGCIHLARGAAATYFSELSIGETVQVVA
ncbi:L,D-transpeptidase [Lentzea tibetensis]|nr:L,D-transpeptidase [Lentzea tibetensis]